MPEMLQQMALTNSTEALLQEGPWQVKEMVLSWEKLEALWDLVKKYKTLFSDLTRGDFRNFAKALLNDNTLWFEVWTDEYLVGLIWLGEMHQTIDASAHMVFFDRKPMEKLAVTRALMRWVFERYPLHRVTVTMSELHHATHRLVQQLGFKHEGKKREAILMGGKWLDVHIYGLTRGDLEAS